MRTLVIGGNGQIGRLLCARLAAAGERVCAMARDEAQRPALEALGAEVVLGDLEGEFAHALAGCDAVVFTAGSGGHTGGDKTLLVDLWGALRSYRACEDAGIERYVMVSAMRAHDPDAGRLSLRHYLVAKKIADEYLTRSALRYTIVCPGRLSDDPGTGRVNASCALATIEYGTIPRQDVASTLAACLGAENTVRKTFDLVSGDTLIAEAISAL